jgi:hypothetical protein
MATLTQLYARIVLDLNRDDMGSGGELEQAKVDAVADAIDSHAGELFWFNRASSTAATVAGAATIALPAGMRVALVVTWLGKPLRKVPLEKILAAENSAAPVSGPPCLWAADGGAIHLWPMPDAAYTLAISGIAELGVPASSNAWTVEGYRLILAEAKKILCRGPLRDGDGMALAADAAREALTALRRETGRRGAAPLAADLPAPGTGFDIHAG